MTAQGLHEYLQVAAPDQPRGSLARLREIAAALGRDGLRRDADDLAGWPARWELDDRLSSERRTNVADPAPPCRDQPVRGADALAAEIGVPVRRQ